MTFLNNQRNYKQTLRTGFLFLLLLIVCIASFLACSKHPDSEEDTSAINDLRKSNIDQETLERLRSLGYISATKEPKEEPSSNDTTSNVTGGLMRLIDIDPVDISIAGDHVLQTKSSKRQTVIDLSKWKAGKSISGFKASDQKVVFIYQGMRPFISHSEVSIRAAHYGKLHLTMKTDNGKYASLFWVTRDSPEYNNEKSITFTLNPDGKYHEYIFDMLNSEYWNGFITGFQFFPIETNLSMWPKYRNRFSADRHGRVLKPPKRKELLSKLGYSKLPSPTGEVAITEMKFTPSQCDYIRRKIQKNYESMEAFYLATPSSITFSLKMPNYENIYLEYCVNTVGSSEDTEVKLICHMQGCKSQNSDMIRMKKVVYGGWWVKRRVDLSNFSGKVLVIEFEVSSASKPGKPVYLGNPILYATSPNTKPPNVVLVAFDALRADRLHCYGYQKKNTPNIDRLAEKGILFQNNYSQANWTRPSFCSMFTSLYVNNPNKKKGVNIFRLFRNNGYYVQGFHCNPNLLWTEYFVDGFDSYIDYGVDLFGQTLVTYSADVGMNLAASWLKSNHKEPFFLLVYILDPHAPYWSSQLGKPWKADSPSFIMDFWDHHHRGITQSGEDHSVLLERASDFLSAEDFSQISELYDDEVQALDKEFGRLIQIMKELRIFDNTIVVVTADHGEELGDHGNLSHSHFYYDEMVKVPLIFSYPTGIKIPRRTFNLTESIDILPTLAEMGGIEFYKDRIDGQSLLPLINGVDGYLKDIAISGTATIYDKYKLIDGNYLFNLEEDPQEKNDLAEKAPHIVKKILKKRNTRIMAGK